MIEKTAQDIIAAYSLHTRLIHRFTEGITHAESVLQPPFEHNCMNWILGHIVANRSHVLESLALEHAWQDPVRGLYHQDTPPVTPEGPSIPLPELIAYLDESKTMLENTLTKASDDWLQENHSNYRGENTRRGHIISFHWHESFHLGQLEILRAFILSTR